jgi:hypothetical protein
VFLHQCITVFLLDSSSLELAIYEGQQWTVNQIQKVAAKMAKDIDRLQSTIAGCDIIRSLDIPPTNQMLSNSK